MCGMGFLQDNMLHYVSGICRNAGICCQLSDRSCDRNNITSGMGVHIQSAATGNCHYANKAAGKSKCYRSCYVCRFIAPDIN